MKGKIIVFFLDLDTAKEEEEDPRLNATYTIVDVSEADWVLNTFRRARRYVGGIDKYLREYSAIETCVNLVHLKKTSLTNEVTRRYP